MIPRTGLAVPVALGLVLGLALTASGQEATEVPDGETTASPTGELDTRVEVQGNRYRFKLKTGSVIEGVLPRGVHWEKLDQFGDFVDAAAGDRGAGLRVQYVLNMEGDIFIKRQDMASKESGELDMRDLGALTEEEKLSIRQRIIADRKKVIEAREKALAAEIVRLTGGRKPGPTGKAGEGGGKEGEAPKSADEEAVKKGDALLEKFPPKEWSEKRLKDILRREVINGIFRNDEEREFIDNFNLWKEALDRQEAAREKAEKGGEGAKPGAGEAGGSGVGSYGSGR